MLPELQLRLITRLITGIALPRDFTPLSGQQGHCCCCVFPLALTALVVVVILVQCVGVAADGLCRFLRIIWIVVIFWVDISMVLLIVGDVVILQIIGAARLYV